MIKRPDGSYLSGLFAISCWNGKGSICRVIPQPGDTTVFDLFTPLGTLNYSGDPKLRPEIFKTLFCAMIASRLLPDCQKASVDLRHINTAIVIDGHLLTRGQSL